MAKITHFIPNALTLCNLVCGVVAIIFAFRGEPFFVFGSVVLAAVFDFADGFAARMFKAFSRKGADLDSLSDMVSFGVAPALAVFVLLEPSGFIAYASLALALGAALRLAKFNIDDRQHEEFRGLPTPAMALFFVSLQFVIPQINIWITIALVGLFTGLMVCDMPMFSLKFSNFSFRQNIVRYVFIALSAVTIALWDLVAPAIIIALYVLFSIYRAITRR